MAKINLPKLGSIEDISTAAAVALVCVLVVGALVGLAIWKGDDGDPAPPASTVPAFDDDGGDWFLEDEVEWCDAFYDLDPFYCDQVYFDAFG